MSTLEHARLQLARGDRVAASGLLADARHTFSELNARPALQQVGELESQLPSRDIDERYGLTARELDVLRLLAHGKSDRAIASEQFISPFAVMRHVSSSLRKRDVDSRTAAATEAVRRDLV